MTQRGDTGALSFETACDALGVHPGLLRRRILEWKHTLRRRQRERGSAPLLLRIEPRRRIQPRQKAIRAL
jgi:hypothetical protein